MTGEVTIQIDTRIIEKRFSDLSVMLFGNGFSGGEVHQALRTECGQLAGRIGDAVGPKTQAGAKQSIQSDVSKQLSILPRYVQNLNQESESYADFTWLYASPNALVGINHEDLQLRASAESALEMFRVNQKHQRQGEKYVRIGRRGRQAVMRFNRTVVTKSTRNKVVRMIFEKAGGLRAAFYSVSKKYIPSKRVPGWIAKRIAFAQLSGKSSVHETGMNSASAAIEFIVKGKGLERNPNLKSKIEGALVGASESMQAKLSKIAKGAKYVVETGQVYSEKS